MLARRALSSQSGVVFRRQVPLLGRFITDFLAPAERFAIVDRLSHSRTLRLGAALIVQDIEAAL